MSWPEISLGEIAEFRNGLNYTKDNEGTGVRVINVKDFGTKNIPDYDSLGELNPLGIIRNQALLQHGDIIFVRSNGNKDLVGRSLFVKQPPENVSFSAFCIRARIPETANPEFYAFFFRTPHFRKRLALLGKGTNISNLNQQVLATIKVPNPSRTVKANIVAAIQPYDDLIENNRRRIQLLEQAARLLYKEWFVYLRFPGHEHTQIIDGVPEGWEKTTIGESASFISRGITPKYDDDAPGIVINQKCIRNRMVNLDFARRQTKQVPPLKLVQFGDVLVNSTGAGTLGRVAQLLSEIDECTVDSHVTIVRPKEDVSVYYFGLHLTGLESYIGTLGRGATNQTELSKDDITALEIVLPSSNSAQIFESIVEPTFREIRILSEQIERLIKARDLLLPKLMNGEVAV